MAPKPYADSVPRFSRSQSRFVSKILLPIGVITPLIVVLGVGIFLQAIRQSDTISVAQQSKTIRQAINSNIRRLARQQRAVAVWDSAVLQLSRPSPDLGWIDTWMGLWLYKNFAHDQVYILNARDEPVYAMIDGKRVSATSYDAVRHSLQPLLDQVGNPPAGLQSSHTRNLSDPALDNPAFPSDPDKSNGNLLEISNRPVAASATKIVPETETGRVPSGSEFVLLSVRFLDRSLLEELSERHLIKTSRFSQANTASPDEVALPLATDLGKPLGFLIWRPELPGTRILGDLGFIALLALCAIILLLILLVWWLRRSVLELQASEAQTHHLAFHDVLTGLPNRLLFDERLTQALARARRGESLAVLTLDLDRLKQVNDTLGHKAGDMLIREFARRVSGLLRDTDTIARLGGDEFAIVQVGIEGQPDAEALCGRILEVVRAPFDLLDHQVFVGTSIGVVLAPEAGQDRAELLRKADIALYQAKNQGRNCHCFFTPSMDERVRLRSQIESNLRVALATGEGLHVFYQPEVSTAGQAIVGLEALIRWQHPTQGTILPGQFIPVAEETGLIGPLGEWVLRQACATSRRWPDLFVAVNLSPVQFRSSGFAERVIAIVRECGADPRRIELEITETALLDHEGRAQEVLQTLRAAGFRIALDDFGTGYSSLSYLRQFKVDKIKIDRSFVQPLGQTGDPDAAAVFAAMVALGRAMGLTVTAEGVETQEQKQVVATAGVSEMQGYLFARPLPEDELAALLASASVSRILPGSNRNDPDTEAA